MWCYVPEDKTNDWARWCFTTIEGGNVPTEEVEAARAQLDARTFRQEFEASFENLSGLVAISFADANISKDVQDLRSFPLLGVDFNVDPCLASVPSKRATLWVFDEIIMTGGATTWDFCEEVHAATAWIAESSAARPYRRSPQNQGVGTTDHSILRKSGFTGVNPKATLEDPRQDHPRQHRPPRRHKHPPPIHHPRCKELIKSLRTLTYAPGTGLPNKNLGVDHAFDALGYLCLQVFNLAKPENIGATNYRVW